MSHYFNTCKIIMDGIEYEPIHRQVSLPIGYTAAYIEPPHAIFSSDYNSFEYMIVTAICWTLGKRPISIPVHRVVLSASMNSTDNAIDSQILVFLGMAGLITINKKLGSDMDANGDDLCNKWQDVCNIIGIKNIFNANVNMQERYMVFIRALKMWQDWIDMRPALYRWFLIAALYFSDTTMLVNTAMAKVKIEVQYFGMKMILKMDAFVSLQNIYINRAIFLPNIAQQAADLRKAMNELRTRYGNRFPYLKIYRLEGRDRLKCKRYPDLYYAVVATEAANKKTKPETVKHVAEDFQTDTAKYIIDAEVKKTMKFETLDEITTANLHFLNIKSCFFSRREKENDDNKQLLRKRPKH